MRVIELSNHPGDMLRDVSLRRQATQRQARARYEHALVQHQARVQVIRVQRARARRNRQLWTWLRLIFAVWAEQRRAPGKSNPGTADTDTEQRIRAGIAGEQLVATELGRALDDDWTLLRGYRNRRGEIDHLLLGPKGLFAVEVKNINATVSVDGDRWRADKYDNYGNLVEQREVADRKGRSPSEQLNEPAGELERFLHERGQRVSVQRVVVLAHKRSRVGSCRHPTVHVGTSADYVLSLVKDSTETLDERQRADAERLIRRDHDFNERRRR
ncbi:MAG TPA: nuclease-related domain-containing protein [Streptosporangiaceae bacterium]|nr:nuclease-related domain-containing protein [Streptosporangiaceae bacterium]